ncbi:cation efflux family protein [Grosmannia clavigera kw1407]|uniref:Cation efflux family protein n=1 Tax=Grosmannia clavigera (strain kw1407 / UAMH 11150) TaxID=655863 RepID=F0XAD6_GROCL|nr:cation efflux family protein [Grosmannia clavigera kw1407]EFX05446.1 cation efflux family protein [Grosmannia clavigera kw1407]
MPLQLRWRCPLGGRPLRLCHSCCAAGLLGAAPGASAETAASRRCGHSHSRLIHHGSRFYSFLHVSQQSLFIKPPLPQIRLQQSPRQSTRHLHASLSSSPLVFSSPTPLLLSPSLSTLAQLPFSTSSSPKLHQYQHDRFDASQSWSPPSRKHRRKLARWLPAIMAASHVRTRSDDSHTESHSQAHSHSHGLGLGHHHHHHDNVYLTSQNKKDAGVRITRIGLYSNLGMAFVKGAGGYFFNSQSMLADAWHSMTDLASDVLTLATVSWSLRPPTDRFPTGFGKVESLGSLGVSGMLLGAGLFMCMSSSQSLYAHLWLDPAAAAEVLAHAHSHGHSHGHGHMHSDGGGPSLHAAWLAAGTVLVKEWLYRATMKVARERKSSVLASNAVHHRVDSLTGIVTLAVILGANFIHDAAWLDPVGGLLISLMVIRAGWENTASALYELADRSIDEDVKRSVRKQITQSLADQTAVPDGQLHLVEVRDVSGVKSGPNYLVDIEMAVPGDWTVDTTRAIEEAVRAQVGGSVRGVRRLRVRFVKLDETTAKFDDFMANGISPRESPEPEEHDHDHGHGHDDHGHDHSNGAANGTSNGNGHKKH